MLFALEKAFLADVAQEDLLHHILRVGGVQRAVQGDAVDHRRIALDDFTVA